MFAGIFCAANGHETHIFEKNEKLGKKLFITGKGRCNLTNACGLEELFCAVRRNEKFLYSSFGAYTNKDVISFFERLGLRTKVERGNRVFPASDCSLDVIKALEKELAKKGALVHTNAEVKRVEEAEGKFSYMELAGGEKVYADACIIATGGLSYPSTGSTGDGYKWARELGHTITELSPGLAPMEIKEAWAYGLMGLSLKNVEASVYDGGEILYRGFGEMLFTHYGVSGPIIISASSAAAQRLKKKNLKLSVDLKPALSPEQLDKRLLRDFNENKNRRFKNSLGKLFPAKLIPVIVRISGIDAEKEVNAVTKKERAALLNLIKNFTMTVSGLRGYKEAIITIGGVSVKEISPKTMESKLIKNLYFAGEVLDLDAFTGGFNLQIAWSTAYTAGRSAGEKGDIF